MPPKRVLDPILTLPVPSTVNSVCFVSPLQENYCYDLSKPLVLDDNDGNDDDSDSSDDDDEELIFRSSSLVQKSDDHQYPPSRGHSLTSLHGRFLATCHQDSGEALLWDLQRNKRILTIQTNRGGGGLCVKRTANTSRLVFQTRDNQGTVSLHAIDQQQKQQEEDATSSSIIRQYSTNHQGFCEAAPCAGDEHLIALPCGEETKVKVMDHRASEPVATLSVDGHGMITSLAMIRHPTGERNVMLCCGAEDGSIILHDVTQSSNSATTTTTTSTSTSYSLGKEPVLTVDVTSSQSKNENENEHGTPSFLIGAGLAGDGEEVLELEPSKAGRAVLLKASFAPDRSTLPLLNNTDAFGWTVQQRARLSTCRVDETSYGKPGVGICRFRPDDGRIFAIGGWDYRVRLFERTHGQPLAIIKSTVGGSLSALDWAPDASRSGLLASASRDVNIIHVWKCYGKRYGG
ncbi:hypothetical protein IV203_028542 [Nitzschia inconspicua]|uniref:Uncharacterized protein n=1 Tax=Nitzschia inconspicua TaxID=303405 RepID=A0A9K3LPA9_9STRA|nr:hypothetical protein IV203_028542 [Nitzschia inconspicua]